MYIRDNRSNLGGHLYQGSMSKIQCLISWIIFLTFIGLVGDFTFSDAFKDRLDKTNEEYKEALVRKDELFSQLNEVSDNFKAKIKDGTLTPKEMAEATDFYAELDQVLRRTGRVSGAAFGGSNMAWAIKEWQNMYYRITFQPPEGAPDSWSKPGHERKMRSRLVAEFDYSQALREHSTRAPYGEEVMGGKEIWTFFKWCLKWYYLFGFPTLICSLLNLWFKRESVLEKIWFDKWQILFRTICFGPIGVWSISESADKYRKYRKLEAELIASKHEDYELTERDRNAIWIKVDEPFLKFEEAVKMVGTVPISKPVLVSLLLWFFSLNMSSVGKFCMHQVDTTRIETAMSGELVNFPDSKQEQNRKTFPIEVSFILAAPLFRKKKKQLEDETSVLNSILLFVRNNLLKNLPGSEVDSDDYETTDVQERVFSEDWNWKETQIQVEAENLSDGYKARIILVSNKERIELVAQENWQKETGELWLEGDKVLSVKGACGQLSSAKQSVEFNGRVEIFSSMISFVGSGDSIVSENENDFETRKKPPTERQDQQYKTVKLMWKSVVEESSAQGFLSKVEVLV